MSEASHDRWMPIYIGAYLKNTGRLRAAQHGAYLLLLIEAWTHDGLIPDDDESLAAITRMSSREWKAMKAVVLSFWTPVDGGFRQQRLDAEIARAKGLVQQKSDAGKASAEARKRKRNGNGRSTGVETNDATEGATKPLRNGRPSPSPDSVSNETGAEAPLIDPEKKAWADAVSLLTTAGKMGDSAARGFVGKLKSDHGIDAKDLLPAIGQAIANQTQDPAGYLRKAAKGIAARKGGGGIAPPSPDDEITDRLWQIRLDGFHGPQRIWIEGQWGPRPGARGCRVPPHLLEPSREAAGAQS